LDNFKGTMQYTLYSFESVVKPEPTKQPVLCYITNWKPVYCEQHWHYDVNP